MNIVISDDYQNIVSTLNCFRKLHGHTVTIYNDSVKDIEELTKRFANANALILIRERTVIDEPLLSRLPQLKLISQTGRGTAHIDMDACKRHNVAVATGVGSPYAPAELTWALIMAAMRQIPQAVDALRAGHWQTTFGFGLRGRTLGIFGYGNIGRLVASYGKAFGMRVLIWGRSGSLSRALDDGYEVVKQQSDLFAECDVVTLHVKLTSETQSLIRLNDLIAMKPTALFVNTSRAELLASGVLLHALQTGRPGYAAVDVYEDEPVVDHPLLHLSNVICTPHLGYVEKDSYELYFGIAFDNVLAFFE